MAVIITRSASGFLEKGPKGSGPRGGKLLIQDTGRALINTLTEMANNAVDQETLKTAGKVVVEAIKEVTPIGPTRALHTSIRAEATTSAKGRPQLKIKAGGPDFPISPNSSKKGNNYVDYAVVVHEEITPYMFIGINNSKAQFEEELAKGVKKKVTKRNGK